jgi:TonB family protein
MFSDPSHRAFSLLPERRAPWREFAFSLGSQALAVVLIAWIGVLHPEVLTSPYHNQHLTSLVSIPATVNHEPAPVKIFKPARLDSLRLPSPEALQVPPDIRPKTQPHAFTPPPRVELASAKTMELPPASPVIPRELVKTNVFSSGSSQTPTLAAAPAKVQTGGFGDPNGVPARENNGKPVTIAAAGSFDAPVGPGHGNGTGGAKGVSGVIASAGFGDGTAVGDGSAGANKSRGNGAVREVGFGGAGTQSADKVRAKPAETVAVKTLPAEITSKPSPTYTEEARKLRIEGEVLVEVVFESSGNLRVVRVVRGLGHGLDDAAIRAAEQIHFKPALREGQPTDSTAVLHIVFQLA